MYMDVSGWPQGSGPLSVGSQNHFFREPLREITSHDRLAGKKNSTEESPGA